MSTSFYLKIDYRQRAIPLGNWYIGIFGLYGHAAFSPPSSKIEKFCKLHVCIIAYFIGNGCLFEGSVRKRNASTQTAGLGQKCAEEAFTAQFIGKSAPLTLGDGIDAVASATITSQAVVDAVNSLYAEAPAKVLTTKVKGWHEGVAVTVEIDKNHVITALTVDASGEFYALGGKCADEAFTAQFIGKSAPLTLDEDIDAVTGATLTSQAVVDAVNQLAK